MVYSDGRRPPFVKSVPSFVLVSGGPSTSEKKDLRNNTTACRKKTLLDVMLLHVRETESGSRLEIFDFSLTRFVSPFFNHTMLRACGQGTPLYTVGLQSILSSTRPACRRALEASHSTLAGSVCGRNEWVLTRLRTAVCISLQVFEVARHVSISMQRRWDFQQSPSVTGPNCPCASGAVGQVSSCARLLPKCWHLSISISK